MDFMNDLLALHLTIAGKPIAWSEIVGNAFGLGSAISAYYYLRLIVVMFFRERTTEWTAPRVPAAMAAVLIITVLGVLYFGVFADGVIQRFSRPGATQNAQLK